MAWYTGKAALSILHIGDSNALGFNLTDLQLGVQTINNNVKCYVRPPNTTYSEATCDWMVVDPNYPVGTGQTDWDSAFPWFGQISQGNGNTGMQVASTVQQSTGITTYLFGAYQGGSNSDFWSTGNGWIAIERNIQDVLDSIPGSPTYFDMIVFSIGGIDIVDWRPPEFAGKNTPTEYFANIQTLRNNMIANGWWVEGTTQIAIQDAPRSPTMAQDGATWKYPPPVYNWNGYELLATQLNDRITFVDSVGFTYGGDVLKLHPLPKYYTEWGVRIGERFANQVPKQQAITSVGGNRLSIDGLRLRVNPV